MTVYHPFRSMTAKEQYLKLYDIRAKKWPVDSQTRLVDTSYGQTFVQTEMVNTKVIEFLKQP